MFTLKIENENAEIVTLTQAEDRYQIVDIDGLNPSNANIATSTVAGMDGAKYASSKLEVRNLVITVRINGDIEKNRLNLYKFFRTKHWCKVYYTNGSRDVYIEGYVETVECDLFELGQEMQISIVCPDPYFQSAGLIYSDISQIVGQFVFPFAFGANGVIEDTITDEAIEFSTYTQDRIVNIVNEGEDNTGVIIQITAVGTVNNPTIYNVDTREGFTVNLTMEKNDVLVINTNRGQKSITLTRDAVVTNMINKVGRDSSWLQLSAGDNQFTYSADEGSADMRIVFTYRTRYGAV